MISQIVKHLRDDETLSVYKVGGITDIAMAEDKSRLPLPALHVALAPSTTEEINPNPYHEFTIENITILAVLDNTLDRSGHRAQDQIVDLKWKLIKSLHKYQLGTTEAEKCRYGELLYQGHGFLQSDRARYFHQFEFFAKGLISPDDMQTSPIY